MTDDAYKQIDRMWEIKAMKNREELQQIANTLIKQYKHEIVRDGDWWHGTPEYSFNIHSPDDDGVFNINVYKVDPVTGMDNYEWWIDLEPVFLGETT